VLLVVASCIIWIWAATYTYMPTVESGALAMHLSNKSHACMHLQTNKQKRLKKTPRTTYACPVHVPASGPVHANCRCPFGPPDPALTRARGGLLNFVTDLIRPALPSHRVVSGQPTGCDDGPMLGPAGLFRAGPGQHEIARPYTRTWAARSRRHSLLDPDGGHIARVAHAAAPAPRVVMPRGVAQEGWCWSKGARRRRLKGREVVGPRRPNAGSLGQELRQLVSAAPRDPEEWEAAAPAVEGGGGLVQ
jgi:hypothetical protein